MLANRYGDKTSDEVRRIVASSPIFSGMNGAHLSAIAEASEYIQCQRGQTLFERGEDASDCYQVVSGRVGLISCASGRRPCMVAIRTPKQLFGDLSLFDSQPRAASAKTLESCTLVRIPYRPLRAILAEEPQLLWGFLQAFAGKVRHADDMLADALAVELLTRLARRLLEIAGDDDVFTLDITQEEMASLVGASRERTNKALSTLVRSGAISISSRTYRIVDRSLLAAYGRQDGAATNHRAHSSDLK